MASFAVTIDVEHHCRDAVDPDGVLLEIIDIADRHGAPINWFIQGRWALANTEMTKRLAARDVVIAPHGFSHVDFTRLTPEGARLEMAEALAVFADLAGHESSFCRTPYGSAGDDSAVLGALGEIGLSPVGWDYSCFDWDPDLDDDVSISRPLGAVETGGVVLMHSWPTRSPRILDALLSAANDAPVYLDETSHLRHLGPTGWRMHQAKLDPPR